MSQLAPLSFTVRQTTPPRFMWFLAFVFFISPSISVPAIAAGDVQLDGQRYSDGDIRVGMPRLKGHVTEEDFWGEVAKRKFGFLWCYDREAKNDRFLSGHGEIQLRISDGGSVQSVKWNKVIPNSVGFVTCTSRIMKRWKFPSGPGTIVFPVEVTGSSLLD